MSFDVMIVVLFSALLHAGWNALVRSSADKFQNTVLIVCGAGLFSAVLLLFLPAPASPSWPYVLASGVIHVFYFSLVALSYRFAELSFAYPVMRGAAPALAALAALFLLHESLSAMAWLGIALICTGVLMLSAAAWRGGVIRRSSVAFALGNACVIAIYTLVDGQGVRLAANALSYTAWVFVLTALMMLAVSLAQRGRRVLVLDAGLARVGLLGGAGTLAAYSLVLWAMMRAPIASVAALRETSIVFAALIGAAFLKERVGRLRLACVLLVCVGAAALKLS